LSPDRHPGITMHRLSFGGGFAGLLFTVGSVLIFVLGFPPLWYFVAFAFILGVGFAIVLRITSNSRTESSKPLSILAASEKKQSPSSPAPEKRQSLLHAVSKPFPA
jgi:hypothetical protein